VLISPALTRWGSCNTRREVRLAWRLVKAPPHLVDYVICHELAHLRHMDHSRRFWAEVERQCPDYRRLRAELHASDHLYRTF
jgi:predicted metal-dependent hydrolase